MKGALRHRYTLHDCMFRQRLGAGVLSMRFCGGARIRRFGGVTLTFRFGRGILCPIPSESVPKYRIGGGAFKLRFSEGALRHRYKLDVGALRYSLYVSTLSHEFGGGILRQGFGDVALGQGLCGGALIYGFGEGVFRLTLGWGVRSPGLFEGAPGHRVCGCAPRLRLFKGVLRHGHRLGGGALIYKLGVGVLRHKLDGGAFIACVLCWMRVACSVVGVGNWDLGCVSGLDHRHRPVIGS